MRVLLVLVVFLGVASLAESWGSSSRRKHSSSSSESSASIPEKIRIDVKGNYPPVWKYIPYVIANPWYFDIKFWLKSASDAYLRLSTKPSPDDPYYYDFYIGYLNNKFVCIYRGTVQVVDTSIGNLLKAGSFVDFRLTFDGYTLSLYKGKDHLLAEYYDPNPYKGIKYIGVTSYTLYDKNPSWWKFEGKDFAKPKSGSSSSSGHYWK